MSPFLSVMIHSDLVGKLVLQAKFLYRSRDKACVFNASLTTLVVVQTKTQTLQRRKVEEVEHWKNECRINCCCCFLRCSRRADCRVGLSRYDIIVVCCSKFYSKNSSHNWTSLVLWQCCVTTVLWILFTQTLLKHESAVVLILLSFVLKDTRLTSSNKKNKKTSYNVLQVVWVFLTLFVALYFFTLSFCKIDHSRRWVDTHAVFHAAVQFIHNCLAVSFPERKVLQTFSSWDSKDARSSVIPLLFIDTHAVLHTLLTPSKRWTRGQEEEVWKDGHESLVFSDMTEWMKEQRTVKQSLWRKTSSCFALVLFHLRVAFIVTFQLYHSSWGIPCLHRKPYVKPTKTPTRASIILCLCVFDWNMACLCTLDVFFFLLFLPDSSTVLCGSSSFPVSVVLCCPQIELSAN